MKQVNGLGVQIFLRAALVLVIILSFSSLFAKQDQVYSGVTSQGNMRDPALSPPWIENFEHYYFPPSNWMMKSGYFDLQNGPDLTWGDGWSRYDFTQGYNYPTPDSEDWAGVGFGENTYEWLITPPIDLGNPGHDNKLRFRCRGGASSSDTDNVFAVVVLDEDGEFTINNPVLATYTTSTYNSYIVLDLANYSGIVRLAFYAGSETHDTYHRTLYLDQIEVSPDDIAPTAAKIISPQDSPDPDQLFRWTVPAGNPDGYKIYIKEENKDWQLFGETEDNFFFIPMPGLAWGCQYETYIRASNSNGNTDSDHKIFYTNPFYILPQEPDYSYSLNFNYEGEYFPYGVITDKFVKEDEVGVDGTPAACGRLFSADELIQFRTPAIALPSLQENQIHLYFKYRLETLEEILDYDFEDGDSFSVWVSADMGRSYHLLQTYSHNVRPGEDFTQRAINFQLPYTDLETKTVTILFKLYIHDDWCMKMFLDDIFIYPLTTTNSIECDLFATGLDFGEVWVSDKKTMDVNLTAPSGYAIVKEISIEGEDASEFVINGDSWYSDPFEIRDNATFQVSFKPHSLGAKNANLKIVDAFDEEYYISLTGDAVWPGPFPLPVFVNFDDPDLDFGGWGTVESPDDEVLWTYSEDPDNENNHLISIVTPEVDHNDDIVIGPRYFLQQGRNYEFRVNYKSTPDRDPVDFTLGYMSDQDINFDENTLQIHVDDITGNHWRMARMPVDTPDGGNFIFTVYTGLCTGNGILYVDNLRITYSESDIVSIISDFDNGVCHLKPAPMWNEEQDGEYIPEATLTGISNIGLVEGLFEWKPPQINIPKRTLVVTLHGNEGASLAGADLVINHNLGYTPHRILRKIDNGGYEDIFNPEDGSWDSGKIALPSEEGALIERMQIVFFEEPSGHTPVSFAGFTAQITSENNVKINWTTLSETGMLGFYLYRANSEELDQAGQVSALIPAHNSSQTQNYSFTDLEITQSGDYYYWLSCMDMDGQTAYHGPCHILVNQSQDPQTPSLPLVTELLNPWPNPFNPDTNIPFSLHKDERVTLEIYNLRGQKITTLLDENKAAGRYQVVWNAKDSNGRELSSGVYMLRMKAGKYQSDRKLMLVK